MLRFPANYRFLLRAFSFFVVTVAISTFAASGQTGKARGADDDTPAINEFRGVSIGMTADEVRKKLGDPSDKGEEQDFFVFNDKETAQVIYDKATRKVTAFSFDYMTGAREVPTAKAIFGSDVAPKADGSVHRLVRYPKAGYWLSFNRTAGDTPITSVTFQKIDR